MYLLLGLSANSSYLIGRSSEGGPSIASWGPSINSPFWFFFFPVLSSTPTAATIFTIPYSLVTLVTNEIHLKFNVGCRKHTVISSPF